VFILADVYTVILVSLFPENLRLVLVKVIGKKELARKSWQERAGKKELARKSWQERAGKKELARKSWHS